MKTFINKLALPLLILLFINAIGLIFYKNYDGAVAGSVVGTVVGLLITEIRTKSE
jgi:hypothetical protein